jgi:transposase
MPAEERTLTSGMHSKMVRKRRLAMSLETPDKIRNLQRKLYCKAKAEPAFRFPWLRHIFADGGYAGDKLRQALKGNGKWKIEIIKRSDTANGFEVLPRRWVVKRTLAWLNRCRRLAKDWEKSIESSTAWAFIASIRMLTRRIARLWFNS